ncbi:MAG: 8-oxo-dGTP diphosphatase [Clostridia bacterium]|nr:8-oxo-dGTP diphosphatase [Clostridia bacterium]
MKRMEMAELTVLCLVRDGDRILLQNRVKQDWQGYTLPGGHVEEGESFVDAVIREVREETGLKICHPRLAGVKQFPTDVPSGKGRYIVFLFVADEFSGDLQSSEEGEMRWVKRSDLNALSTVDDFEQLLQVMERPELTEFQYLVDGDDWRVRVR